METLKLVMADLRKKHVNKFIMVGDLLDKGNATMETLEFITQNIHLFHLVRGNHEVAISIIEDNARRRELKEHRIREGLFLSVLLYSSVCFPNCNLTTKKLFYHLKGIKTVREDKLEFFTSVPMLETNEKARELFLALYERARPFLRCLPSGKSPSFIVTHAPCLNKYPK